MRTLLNIYQDMNLLSKVSQSQFIVYIPFNINVYYTANLITFSIYNIQIYRCYYVLLIYIDCSSTETQAFKQNSIRKHDKAKEIFLSSSWNLRILLIFLLIFICCSPWQLFNEKRDGLPGRGWMAILYRVHMWRMK